MLETDVSQRSSMVKIASVACVVHVAVEYEQNQSEFQFLCFCFLRLVIARFTSVDTVQNG